MAWHRPHDPWSLEVKKRAAGTVAKLMASAEATQGREGSLSETLMAAQVAAGRRDPVLELGDVPRASSGDCHTVCPCARVP